MTLVRPAGRDFLLAALQRRLHGDPLLAQRLLLAGKSADEQNAIHARAERRELHALDLRWLDAQVVEKAVQLRRVAEHVGEPASPLLDFAVAHTRRPSAMMPPCPLPG